MEIAARTPKAKTQCTLTANSHWCHSAGEHGDPISWNWAIGWDMDRRLQPIILRGSGDSPIHLEHRHQTIVENVSTQHCCLTGLFSVELWGWQSTLSTGHSLPFFCLRRFTASASRTRNCSLNRCRSALQPRASPGTAVKSGLARCGYAPAKIRVQTQRTGNAGPSPWAWDLPSVYGVMAGA